MDTGCEVELVLPMRKVEQLGLKPVLNTEGKQLSDTADTPTGEMVLLQFEAVLVTLPYTGGQEGAASQMLQVFAPDPSSIPGLLSSALNQL